MNDGIQFDTSSVRGFAEWLHHRTNGEGGYTSRIDSIIAKLGVGAGSKDGGGYNAGSAEAQTIGTSGVEYYGKDYGTAETENAEAAVTYLNTMRKSLIGMSDAAGVAAEDFSGQDGKNADELEQQFKPG